MFHLMYFNRLNQPALRAPSLDREALIFKNFCKKKGALLILQSKKPLRVA